MVKSWALDRKSAQEKSTFRPKPALSLKSYVETHRKKVRSTHNASRLKTALRNLKQHEKTLVGRHTYHERLRTSERIQQLETRLSGLSSGTCQPLSEFDSIVQPYLQMVQEMSESSSEGAKPRPKARSGGASAGKVMKNSRSSFDGDVQSYDESSLRD